MNKTSYIFLIITIFILIISGILLYQDNKELERLKSISEVYAKENESLKIDNEMLRKKLAAEEIKTGTPKTNDFSYQQQQKFKAMKDEIARLRAENNPETRDREEEIWNYTLGNVNSFIDIELTKRLASFGFKPEETAICVEEYKDTIAKSKDVLLQWYRNEIGDSEYSEKILDISREFYKNMSESVGENLASITISIVLPDPEFRKKMFEGK
ncbi:hypothetical protein J5681_02590 [bacterium]|nr:hypothetical protein [bacterium]